MSSSHNRSLVNLVTLLLNFVILTSVLYLSPVAAQGLSTPNVTKSFNQPTSESTGTTTSVTSTTTSSSSSQITSTSTSSSSVITTNTTSDISTSFTPTATPKTRTITTTTSTEESTSNTSSSSIVESTPSTTSSTISTSRVPPTTHQLAPTTIKPLSISSTPAITSTPVPTPTIANNESGSTSSDSAAPSDNASAPKGFLQNTAAAASTFTILGVLALAATAFGVLWWMRRRRRRIEADFEDGDFLDGSPDKSFGRRGHETYQSSFVIGEKDSVDERENVQAHYEASSGHGHYEEETALGHPPMEHNTFSDPYHNNYALPNASIIPDEYRLSLLEQAQRNTQPRMSNYAGQLQNMNKQHQNYGSASNTVAPLGNGNPYSISGLGQHQQQQPAQNYDYGYPPTPPRQYEQAPAHYLQEPHVLYQSQPSQLQLQRQPSGKGNPQWGVAC